MEKIGLFHKSESPDELRDRRGQLSAEKNTGPGVSQAETRLLFPRLPACATLAGDLTSVSLLPKVRATAIVILQHSSRTRDSFESLSLCGTPALFQKPNKNKSKPKINRAEDPSGLEKAETQGGRLEVMTASGGWPSRLDLFSPLLMLFHNARGKDLRGKTEPVG